MHSGAAAAAAVVVVVVVASAASVAAATAITPAARTSSLRGVPAGVTLGVVGDGVGQVAKLRLQAGLAAVNEAARHAAGLLRFELLGVAR